MTIFGRALLFAGAVMAATYFIVRPASSEPYGTAYLWACPSRTTTPSPCITARAYPSVATCQNEHANQVSRFPSGTRLICRDARDPAPR
jgi:hypothetical protein